MQVIIFKNDKGGVSTCIPTGEIPLEEVLAKDVPKNRDARIVEQTSLPYDYSDFYNAWEMTSSSVVVNKAKAVELTKQRLRIERKPLLEAQDIAFQKALETGSDTSEIVREKQRLRDITSLATEDKTLEELRSLSVNK